MDKIPYRQRIALAYFDTICNQQRGDYKVPASGFLFAALPTYLPRIHDDGAREPNLGKGIFDGGGVFGDVEAKKTNRTPYGCFPSDDTARIERLVLEAKTPNILDLGTLRTGLTLGLILGEKKYPVLPPFLDKIDPDGVARYDYFCDPSHNDESRKMMNEYALKEGRALEPLSAGAPCVPARQGFVVTWFASEAAHKVLLNPETLARVWIQGEYTRDV